MQNLENLNGLSYPLQLNGKGGLLISHAVDVIRDNIISLLETEVGERVMRLDYGFPNLLFTSKQSWQFTAPEVERLLAANIPQASFNVTSSFNDAGEMLIQINWSVNNSEQAPLVVQA